MFHDIPRDPSRREYQQGSTLGAAHRHWRRAKFFQQFRLFFRFHTGSWLIVLGWVHDTDTKRAYGSKTDAYRVFQSMLASGQPPDNWEELLQYATQAAEACGNSAIVCLERMRKRTGSGRQVPAGIGPVAASHRKRGSAHFQAGDRPGGP